MEAPSSHWEEFYLGSRQFQCIADTLGMPIDQVNFILGQLMALFLAYLFRVQAHPTKVSDTTRHWGSLVAGLGISYFCFGKQVVLALVLVIGCYILMITLPITLIHHVTLISSITFLSVMHIQRQLYEDGVFVIDVTGPMMIMVQKATALAYSLHDGLSGLKDEELTPLQRELVLRKKPSALQYFSYMINFHSVLAGPFFMFADYQDFIEGTHYAKRALNHTVPKDSLDSNRNENPEDAKVTKRILKPEEEPDPTNVSLSKAGFSFVCAFVTVAILPKFPISHLTEPYFFKSSFLYKTMYIVAVTSLTRHVYYTGWILADSICNMSGMGFNGYDNHGAAKWDLVSNVNVLGIEFGSNLRESLEAWNSGTMKWLRFMVYERAPFQKTLFTYMLSSLWHGFYPGYYLTFIGGAFFTVVARTVRRSVRPHILSRGPKVKFAYDIVTSVATRLNLAYLTFPFVLLRFWGTIEVLKSLYFYQTVIGILVIAVLPKILSPPRNTGKLKPSKVQSEASASQVEAEKIGDSQPPEIDHMKVH
ncbi:lysophospholipid acyltransferase 6-like isoform X1 [Macrobrachium nipponense]|uniref:lysophospholipid acyltransferase 6-like isoform X1 n=1 Tax=Macrobrachium nipponense TaxID=159736 RepID=UPI0030C838A0